MSVFKGNIILLIFVALFFGLPFFAFASATEGRIDRTYKYGWSNNIGVINFAPTDESGSYQGLVVTDSSVTGAAWSNKFGWISFGPFLNGSGGGVANTKEGVLSGYAWGKNLGWINFSGVTINSQGQFTGKTTNNNIVGMINFDLVRCTDCGVKTDWRPESVRSGSGLPMDAFVFPVAPTSGFSVLINNSDVFTKNLTVELKLQGGSNVKKMAISNFPNFENAVQEDYQTTKIWNLSAGDGLKTVYVKFYTQYGQQSQIVSGSIILNTQPPEIIIDSGAGAGAGVGTGTGTGTGPVAWPFVQPAVGQSGVISAYPISEEPVSAEGPSVEKKEEPKSEIKTSNKTPTSLKNNWSIWLIEPIQKFILLLFYWLTEKVTLLWWSIFCGLMILFTILIFMFVKRRN